MQKKLSDKELRDFYDRIMGDPTSRGLNTVINKFNQLCEDFDDVRLDVSGETDEFKNFMSFSKQMLTMIDDIKKMQMGLDPERAEAVKEEQSASTKAALENFVRNKPQ